MGNADRGAPVDSGPGGMSPGIGGQDLFSINDQFMQMNLINQRVRLAMRFTPRAGEAHPFMCHCHILEHEGNGMMGQFTVD